MSGGGVVREGGFAQSRLSARAVAAERSVWAADHARRSLVLSSSSAAGRQAAFSRAGPDRARRRAVCARARRRRHCVLVARKFGHVVSTRPCAIADNAASAGGRRAALPWRLAGTHPRSLAIPPPPGACVACRAASPAGDQRHCAPGRGRCPRRRVDPGACTLLPSDTASPAPAPCECRLQARSEKRRLVAPRRRGQESPCAHITWPPRAPRQTAPSSGQRREGRSSARGR